MKLPNIYLRWKGDDRVMGLLRNECASAFKNAICERGGFWVDSETFANVATVKG